jgi:4-hydroxybenzoate polyprenyltransferase
MTAKKSAHFHVWLQLLRAPNLFTVPGDPLAGFLLVSGGNLDWRAAVAVLAALCFYAAGLLDNDLADYVEDRRERPARPLPSGAAHRGVVSIVAVLLGLTGLGLCAAVGLTMLTVGVALVIAIALYNHTLKRLAIAGPINMGLCRGLSLLLGAVAVRPDALPPLVLHAAFSLTLYIALVTHLARIETASAPPKVPRFLPFVGLVFAVVVIAILGIDRTAPFLPMNIALYAVGASTLYAGFMIHRQLTREPAPPIPPMIGQLIRLLLPLQAIWCLASRSVTGGLTATLLLAVWPISRAVSRRFYAS